MIHENQRIQKIIFILTSTAFISVSLTWFFLNRQTKLPAISLSAPGKKFAAGYELKPENILSLLSDAQVNPTSNPSAPVDEPELPQGQFDPPDAAALGFGKSKFLVDSKWATIRYLGENPAGAGLTGLELNKAQSNALGTDKDTIPVITAAQTINDMMEQYFVPLLQRIPRGDDILSRIKVQGAYISPRFQSNDGSTLERDNAFVIGVQSLFIYPNSCFDKTSASACSPQGFSAGHDPTIIGHELGHIIFNHIRDERSLEGWQWFAVNEGYADYFSAAFFGDPILGRIWRVSKPSGARYLRRLLDTPTTNDAKSLEEGHAFGLVWSSALWRTRNKLISSLKINGMDFDRVVLMSINFLGESTKTKLGDAASAVLKSADISGFSAWKPILISEFTKAEVDLSRGQKIASASGEVISKQQSGIVCGSLAHSAPLRSSGKNLTGFFLLLPVLFVFKRMRKDCRIKLKLALLSSIFIQGCQLVSLWKSPSAKPEGLAILYNCNLSALRDGTPSMPNQRKLSLTFMDDAPVEPRMEQIFVGDERFQNADSSLLLLVDKETMRIDQIRRRDGSLFQLNLNQKYVSAEDALAVQNMRLGTIILEGVGRALLNQKKQQPVTANGTNASAISFEMTGAQATATVGNDVSGARGFGPLANEISLNGETLCKYQSTTR